MGQSVLQPFKSVVRRLRQKRVKSPLLPFLSHSGGGGGGEKEGLSKEGREQKRSYQGEF